MRLIQCDYQGQVRAALVESEQQVRLLDCDTYTLANRAINAGQSLSDSVTAALTDTRLDYQALVDDKHLLPPLVQASARLLRRCQHWTGMLSISSWPLLGSS